MKFTYMYMLNFWQKFYRLCRASFENRVFKNLHYKVCAPQIITENNSLKTAMFFGSNYDNTIIVFI